MVNKVILVGIVGKDPEIQNISGDIKLAKFSLATTESYKNKSGEKVENTEWHNITAFRGLANVIENYVKKGDKLYIEGKIVYKSYEKDGAKKYYTEIVASEMKMLGSKQQVSNQNNNQSFDDVQDNGDDLPF